MFIFKLRIQIQQFLFAFFAIIFVIGFGFIGSSTNQLNAYNAENHDSITITETGGENAIAENEIWRSKTNKNEFFITVADQELKVTFGPLLANNAQSDNLKWIGFQLTKVVDMGDNLDTYYQIARFASDGHIKYIFYDGESPISSYTDVTSSPVTGREIPKHNGLNVDVFERKADGWIYPQTANFYVNIASMLAGGQAGGDIELSTAADITLDDAKELWALIELRFAELDVEQWTTFGTEFIKYDDSALAIGLKLSAAKNNIGVNDYFQLLYKRAISPTYWGIDATAANYESTVIPSPVNAGIFASYTTSVDDTKAKLRSLFQSTLAGNALTATKQHASVLYDRLSENFEPSNAIEDGGWEFESSGIDTDTGNNYIIYTKDFIDTNTGDSETVVSAKLKFFLSGDNKGKVSAHYTYLDEKIFATGYGTEEEFSSVEELSNVELIDKWFKCKLIIQAMMNDGWTIQSNTADVWNLEKTLGSYVFRVKIKGPQDTFDASGNFQITLLSTQNDSIYAIVDNELDITSVFAAFTTVDAINSLVNTKLIELIDTRITAPNLSADSISENGWGNKDTNEIGFTTYSKINGLKLKLITSGDDIGKIVVYKEGTDAPSILSESSLAAAEIWNTIEQLTDAFRGWTAVSDEVGLYTKQFYTTNISVFLKFETMATDTYTANFKLYVFNADHSDHSGADTTKTFVDYSIGDDATDIHTEFDAELTIKKISVMLIVQAFTDDLNWNNETLNIRVASFTRTISDLNFVLKIPFDSTSQNYGAATLFQPQLLVRTEGRIGTVSSNQILASDPITVIEKFVNVYIQIKLMHLKLTTNNEWTLETASTSETATYYYRTFTPPSGSDVKFFIKLKKLSLGGTNAEKFELYTTVNSLYDGEKSNAKTSPTKLFLINATSGAKQTLDTDVLLVSADYEISDIAIIINMYLNDLYLTTNGWATPTTDSTHLIYTKIVWGHEFILKLESSGSDVNNYKIFVGTIPENVHPSLETDFTNTKTNEFIVAWFTTEISNINTAIENTAWSTKTDATDDLYTFTLSRAGFTFYLELNLTGDDTKKYTIFTTDTNSATSGTRIYYNIDGTSTAEKVAIAYTDSNNAAATISTINNAALLAIEAILVTSNFWTADNDNSAHETLNTYTKSFNELEFTLTVKKTTDDATKIKITTTYDSLVVDIVVEDTVWLDYTTSVSDPINNWSNGKPFIITNALTGSSPSWTLTDLNIPNTYEKTYSGKKFFIDIDVGLSISKYTIYTTNDDVQSSTKAHLTTTPGLTIANEQLIRFTDINAIDTVITNHLVALIDTELLTESPTVFNPVQWVAATDTNDDKVYTSTIHTTEFTLHLETATGKIKLFHSGDSQDLAYLLGSESNYVDYYDVNESVKTELNTWNTAAINAIKIALTNSANTNTWTTNEVTSDPIIYTLVKNSHTFTLKLYTSLANSGKISLAGDGTPSNYLLGGDDAASSPNFVNIDTIDAEIDAWLGELISAIVTDLTSNFSWANVQTDTDTKTKTLTKNVSGTEFTLVLSTDGTNAEKFQIYTNDYGDGATNSYVIGDGSSYQDSSVSTADSVIQVWIDNNKAATTLLGISLTALSTDWTKVKMHDISNVYTYKKQFIGIYTITLQYIDPDSESNANKFRLFQIQTALIPTTNSLVEASTAINELTTYSIFSDIETMIIEWLNTTGSDGWTAGNHEINGEKIFTKDYFDSNADINKTFTLRITSLTNKIYVETMIDSVTTAVIASADSPIDLIGSELLDQKIQLFLITTAINLEDSGWTFSSDFESLKIYTKNVGGKTFKLKIETSFSDANSNKIKLYVDLHTATPVAALSTHDSLTELSVGWIEYMSNEMMDDRINSWFDDRVTAIKDELATRDQTWIPSAENAYPNSYAITIADEKLFFQIITTGDFNAQYVLFKTEDNMITGEPSYFNAATLTLDSDAVYYEFSSLKTLAAQTALYYKNSEFDLLATQLEGWTKSPDSDSGFVLYTKVILGQEFTLKLKLSGNNAGKYQLYIDNSNSDDSDSGDVFLPSEDWSVWTNYEAITTKINNWNDAEIAAIESGLTTKRVVDSDQKSDNDWSVWVADSDNPDAANQNIYTQTLDGYTFTLTLQTLGDDARKFMISVVREGDDIVENPYGVDSGLQKDFSVLYIKLDEWLATKARPIIYTLAWVFGIIILVLLVAGLFVWLKPKPKP